jgi:hypothetical protein
VGWDWVPRYCGHFGLLYKPQMTDEDDFWSNWWNENWQEKPKYSEKTCPSAILSTTKSHMTRPGLEPRTVAVGSQRLTVWAMAWPYLCFMPSVGFEPMILASKRAKTVHALDHSVTVTGFRPIKHEGKIIILYFNSHVFRQQIERLKTLEHNCSMHSHLNKTQTADSPYFVIINMAGQLTEDMVSVLNTWCVPGSVIKLYYIWYLCDLRILVFSSKLNSRKYWEGSWWRDVITGPDWVGGEEALEECIWIYRNT